MSRRRKTQVGDPKTHTAIIGDVRGMWHKLAWDIEQFDEIQRAFPDIKEPLAYAAINVTITAASLADWTVAEVVSKARASGEAKSEDQVRAYIHRCVPLQRACEAIANTAKHSRLNRDAWPNGSVGIFWDEGDEDTPPGYTLCYLHDGPTDRIALNAFMRFRHDWWAALQSLGVTFPGGLSDAEWWQHKMRATFGSRVDDALLPPDR